MENNPDADERLLNEHLSGFAKRILDNDLLASAVVKRSNEFAQAHALMSREFLQDVPIDNFKAYRCGVPADPDRACPAFVSVRGLRREETTHGDPPRFYCSPWTVSNER